MIVSFLYEAVIGCQWQPSPLFSPVLPLNTLFYFFIEAGIFNPSEDFICIGNHPNTYVYFFIEAGIFIEAAIILYLRIIEVTSLNRRQCLKIMFLPLFSIQQSCYHLKNLIILIIQIYEVAINSLWFPLSRILLK